MSTWIAFYVKTNNEGALIEKLKLLTGASPVPGSSFPKDIYDNFLIGQAIPNYLAIGKTQPDWVTIVYNSSDKLAEWCSELSKELGTKVIVTLAQSVSDYYYFALYEMGKKRRELEFCYSTDFENIDAGERFPFEEDLTDKSDDDGDDFYFDFESIEKYCSHLGLVLQLDYDKTEWTILKGKKTGKTIEEFTKGYKKPWWKFW